MTPTLLGITTFTAVENSSSVVEPNDALSSMSDAKTGRVTVSGAQRAKSSPSYSYSSSSGSKSGRHSPTRSITTLHIRWPSLQEQQETSTLVQPSSRITFHEPKQSDSTSPANIELTSTSPLPTTVCPPPCPVSPSSSSITQNSCSLPLASPNDLIAAEDGASRGARSNSVGNQFQENGVVSGYQPGPGFRYTILESAPSLPEVHNSIAIPSEENSTSVQRCMAFAGLGLMVSVGYMDPGNWATDISGGAQFGYTLLFIVLLSNFMAMFLQYLALKLGIATGRDLAQACRDAYPQRVCITLWILAEIAIAATDLAEVIGSAIALNLLFGIPIAAGCAITMVDVLVVMLLEQRSIRYLEAFIAILTLTIGGVFAYEIAVANPDWRAVGLGLLPSSSILTNSDMLFNAIGIIGATVMPHNLYLHSSIIQSRRVPENVAGKSSAIKYGGIDSTVSLFFAFFINSAILLVSAAAFHNKTAPDGTDLSQVADINSAYELLSPSLGVKVASTVFAVGLLASSQQSTITGTLAGQIVMEGFLQFRMKPALRRLLTRSIAIIPAFITALIAGDDAVGHLLIISQVILSFQLSFAVVPLVMFTSDYTKMGVFVNSLTTKITAVLLTLIIIGLNSYLLIDTFIDPSSAGW